jgi:putative ATP-dependent endonuclease of OLD family
MLFQAFEAANLDEAYAPESIPILALEEPEAHLHPSAIRSLGSSLESMPGQILVSSHSGDLVSRVPIMSLRRLYKTNGQTSVGRVTANYLTPREIQAIDYNICLTRGSYLFSRCWLLVEGESDFHIMPLIFEAMGQSQDTVSFSVLEISQVIDKGEPFIKFAKALGIEWFLMADGDAAGVDYVTRANNYLVSGETLASRACNLVQLDIEHEFWQNGYDDFVRNMLSTSRRTRINAEAAGDAAKETKLLIKAAIKQAGGKPAFARALMQEVQQRGIGTIPQTIKDIVTRVVQLAGG